MDNEPSNSSGLRFSLIGAGRAGSAMEAALVQVGWRHVSTYGRGDSPADAGKHSDLVIIATPDRAIAEAAAAVRPRPHVVLAHLSGSVGLEALGPHEHRLGVHPLVAIPEGEAGTERLRSGAWFGVASSTVWAAECAGKVVDVLGGHAFDLNDNDRARYHAAACIASNHLVALLGQVERVAGSIGVPPEAFGNLIAGTVSNVRARGAKAALTGPAQRQDWDTIEGHLGALEESEIEGYLALLTMAVRLVDGTEVPERLFNKTRGKMTAGDETRHDGDVPLQ